MRNGTEMWTRDGRHGKESIYKRSVKVAYNKADVKSSNSMLEGTKDRVWKDVAGHRGNVSLSNLEA